jgi:hypothetical protein
VSTGIHVTYHDDELECKSCGEYSAVTITWDHETGITYWECPWANCGYENTKWAEDYE